MAGVSESPHPGPWGQAVTPQTASTMQREARGFLGPDLKNWAASRFLSAIRAVGEPVP